MLGSDRAHSRRISYHAVRIVDRDKSARDRGGHVRICGAAADRAVVFAYQSARYGRDCGHRTRNETVTYRSRVLRDEQSDQFSLIAFGSRARDDYVGDARARGKRTHEAEFIGLGCEYRVLYDPCAYVLQYAGEFVHGQPQIAAEVDVGIKSVSAIGIESHIREFAGVVYRIIAVAVGIGFDITDIMPVRGRGRAVYDPVRIRARGVDLNVVDSAIVALAERESAFAVEKDGIQIYPVFRGSVAFFGHAPVGSAFGKNYLLSVVGGNFVAFAVEHHHVHDVLFDVLPLSRRDRKFEYLSYRAVFFGRDLDRKGGRFVEIGEFVDRKLSACLAPIGIEIDRSVADRADVYIVSARLGYAEAGQRNGRGGRGRRRSRAVSVFGTGTAVDQSHFVAARIGDRGPAYPRTHVGYLGYGELLVVDDIDRVAVIAVGEVAVRVGERRDFDLIASRTAVFFGVESVRGRLHGFVRKQRVFVGAGESAVPYADAVTDRSVHRSPSPAEIQVAV